MSENTEQTAPEAETEHELVLVNRFRATPDEVWSAWTDPASFVQWWAPPAWSVTDVTMEVRPRGRFRQTQSSPDGDMVVPFAGFYREVDEPGKLVFTLTDAPSPDDDARTVLTVLLRAADGGTEQEFHQTGVVTQEHFDALKAGTEMFFDRLREFLER